MDLILNTSLNFKYLFFKMKQNTKQRKNQCCVKNLTDS